MRYKNFKEWVDQVPNYLKRDMVWHLVIYQKSVFLNDLAWEDCGKLMHNPRGKAISGQLIRSMGSISANIEEGYGRGFGKDYARFLRIATGSARESRGWYHRGRFILGEDLVTHRINLLDQIISGLVKIERQQKYLL